MTDEPNASIPPATEVAPAGAAAPVAEVTPVAPVVEVAPVVQEAMKKAAVAWVAVDTRDPVALWCVPLDGALYVVSGTGEQSAPGLAEAATAQVTLRGDHGGRIVTWPAEVSRVAPDTEAWAAVAPQVAAKRLNSAEPAVELAQRWARECVLSRLAPAGAPLAAGDTLPAGSLAAPPRPTPAARQTRKPFRLHRVRGR